MTEATARPATHLALAHLVLRLALGVNLLVHGLIRLPKLGAFREWMTGMLAAGPLPPPLVGAFATGLPFVETGLGLLLVLGWRTRDAALASGLLMVALIFGSGTIEKWEWAATQMIYALFAALLLALSPHDRFSLDTACARRRAAGKA